MSESVLMSYAGKLSREELALVPTPEATATHKPIPHVEVVNSLIETLGFRHISVIKQLPFCKFVQSRSGEFKLSILK